MAEEVIQFVGNDWPMTDGDYIRNVDYKDFNPENATLQESSRGAYMIAEMLRQEYQRDYKLEPSNVAMNNVPMTNIPFNRHTVTIGIGNNVIDYKKVQQQQVHVQEAQSRIAWEIEKVKEEMEKVRIIQQAWYDDFKNNKYINDISLADIKSRGFGDAKIDEKMQTSCQVRNLDVDAAGIVLVRNVSTIDGQTTNSTLVPRSRYLMTSNNTESSSLPRVSM